MAQVTLKLTPAQKRELGYLHRNGFVNLTTYDNAREMKTFDRMEELGLVHCEWTTATLRKYTLSEKGNVAVADMYSSIVKVEPVSETIENEPVAETVAIVSEPQADSDWSHPYGKKLGLRPDRYIKPTVTSEPQAKVESKFYTYYGNEVKLLGWVVVGKSAMCEYVSGNLDSREIDISYLRANEGLSEIIDYLNALETPVSTPKIDREQYITACWYVRFLQHNTGVVDIAENYSDYYGGFMKRTWNRDTSKTYPAFIDTHIWQLALDAWVNKPSPVTIDFPMYSPPFPNFGHIKGTINPYTGKMQ